jgi:pathogenesis-related protein 1
MFNKIKILILLCLLPSFVDAAPDSVCTAILKMAQKPDPPLRSLKELKERFLWAHNNIRQQYRLPALSWDNNLASYAQQWAQYLKDHNKCQMMHRSMAGKTEGKKYGENLGFNWTSMTLPANKFSQSPDYVVKGFAKECADYNYQKNSCAKGKVCGHFTQLVWKNSKKVGCGVVTCDGAKNSYGKGRVELWVCNYDPPGNYISQKPF